jgi:hypothetical protein
VHGAGTDLDFYGLAERARQNGMERLIAIRFRNGNVVFETARDWFVEVMDNPEGPIAVIDTFHADTKGINVKDLSKWSAFSHHFLIDTEKMLFPANDLDIPHPSVIETFLDGILDARNDFLAVSSGLLDGLSEDLCPERIHGGKPEIFELKP